MTQDTAPDQRILELIAAYGADPLAWPAEDRTRAEEAIERQPDLYASALAEAHLLDEALKRETVPEPSIALIEGVLRAAPEPTSMAAARPWWVSTLFPNGARWPAGAALASLAMGLVGGYAYAATAPAPYTEAEEVYIEAFGYETYDTWLSQEATQ